MRRHMKTFTCEAQGHTMKSPGVHWGRPLEIVHQKGNHYVLRRKGHMTSGGVGAPQRYVETLYLIVRVDHEYVPAERALMGKAFDRDVATVLDEKEPDRRGWRQATLALFAACDEAAAQAERERKEAKP